jgi:hypothetical protein
VSSRRISRLVGWAIASKTSIGWKLSMNLYKL